MQQDVLRILNQTNATIATFTVRPAGLADVLAMVEGLITALVPAVTPHKRILSPFPKLSHHEVLEHFGIDKPDLRFGMELTELTDVFAGTEFKAFAGAACIKGINAAGKADDYGRNKLDGMTDKAKKMGAKGLVWIKVGSDGELESPVSKFLSEGEQAELRARLDAKPGDLLLIVADAWTTACEVLGTLRNDIARPPVL
jgi:aspartyl-tRNA synthetase